jgi:hypothetical protein
MMMHAIQKFVCRFLPRGFLRGGAHKTLQLIITDEQA